MYNVGSVNEPVQGSCGGMQTTKKGKLCCNVKQVDGLMIEKILSPVKYCPKSEVNLFPLPVSFLMVQP